MALPSAAGQRPPLPHSSAAGPGRAPSRPLMKKIKRTSFPDWEEGPSPKRSAMAPVPKPLAANSRFSSSHRVQDAQKKWEEQQQQQEEEEHDRQQRAATEAMDALPTVVDDSGSEYFTSDSTASHEESESDSEAEPKTTRAAQRRSQGEFPTGLESGSALHQHGLQEGTVTPWKLFADSSLRHGDSHPVSYSTAPRASSAHQAPQQASPSTGPVAAVLSNVLAPQTGDQTVKSIERIAEDDLGGRGGYRHHLSPNELEAKIRRDSEKALLGKDTAGSQADTTFRSLQN